MTVAIPIARGHSPRPDSSRPEIMEIDRLHLAYTEVARYDVTELDSARRVQVREGEHYAPKENVERYAVQMGEANAFPPVIVTADRYIVDGNTRVGAKLLRRAKFKDDVYLPAIVLDVAYEGARPQVRAELEALAATLNSQNGQALTVRERRAFTAKLIGLGWKNEQIARAIGIATGGVTQVKQEIDAQARLTKVGIATTGVKDAGLRALGRKEVLALNDQPFKVLAGLAGEAGLNATEIGELAKQAKATGSDTDALDVLSKAYAEMGDRIKEHSLTGASKPPLARQLRQHLGFINKYAADGAELIETNVAASEHHTDVVRTAIEVLTRVLAAQQERASA